MRVELGTSIKLKKYRVEAVKSREPIWTGGGDEPAHVIGIRAIEPVNVVYIIDAPSKRMVKPYLAVHVYFEHMGSGTDWRQLVNDILNNVTSITEVRAND